MGIFIDNFAREIMGLPPETDDERQQREPADRWSLGIDDIYQECLMLRELDEAVDSSEW